jgi:hypothetical protein
LKQIELTSKLMLAIIGLVSLSAILIPTYAVPTIRSGDIFDGEVKTADLANNAVTSPKIKDGEVTSADIKDATITSTDIAPGTIPSGGSTPADNSVTSAKIVNGEVKTEDLASGAVKPNVHIVKGDGTTIGPGGEGGDDVSCPAGEILTGGGFQSPNVQVSFAGPADEDTWITDGDNVGTLDGSLTAIAFCMGPSP